MPVTSAANNRALFFSAEKRFLNLLKAPDPSFGEINNVAKE